MPIKQQVLDFLANVPPQMLGDFMLNVVRVGNPAAAIAISFIIVRAQGFTKRSWGIIAAIVVYLLTLLLAIPSLTTKPYGDYIVSIGGIIRSGSYLVWLVLILLSVKELASMNAYMKRILRYRQVHEAEEEAN